MLGTCQNMMMAEVTLMKSPLWQWQRSHLEHLRFFVNMVRCIIYPHNCLITLIQQISHIEISIFI